MNANRSPISENRIVLGWRSVPILVVTLLALTGPLLGSTWYAFELQRNALERTKRVQMEQLLNVLAEGMRDPIWNLSPDAGRPLMESVLSTPGVLAVHVDSADQGTFLDDGSVANASSRQVIKVHRDVRLGDMTIGFVELAYDPRVANPYGSGFSIPMALALAIQICVSGGIVFLLLRHFISAERLNLRAAANAEIRDREERLRSIIDNSPSSIILKDSEGRIQIANRRSKELLERDPDELIGVVPTEQYSAERAAEVRGYEQQTRETKTPITYERRLRTKDGPKDFIITKFPIFDEAGDVVRVGTIATDISKQKRVEQELTTAKAQAEHANTAKSEFLASMSHDLRTPLNAIIGFADMIRQQYFGDLDPRYLGYAEDIHRSGSHLLSLVDQILDLSVIESGNLYINREELDIGEVIEWCEKTVHQEAEERGIRLTLRMHSSPLKCFADRRALMQILINLLSNSIKFTPDGGSVILSAMRTGDEVLFTVADTGCGIHPDDLNRIMQPFSRAELDPFLSKQGWGLGLAITRALTELHGGKFSISSILGQGTTAVVSLPLLYSSNEAEVA